MTAAATPSLPVPSFDRPKMEDRKRSLVPDSDEPVSRSKRIKDESGAPRMSAENEAAVEAYQKDAILRQMNEYKREQKYWQKEYTKLSEKLTHHDDHLRTIDAWFSQLLDEVRILAADFLPTPPTSATSASGGEIFNSALEFTDNEQFSTHLSERSQKIKDAIKDIFGRIPNASPEVLKLQNQLASALAEEKVAIARCQGLDSEKQQLTDRLETASYRYLKAEKAVERAKSLQVQKLERQAMLGGNGEVSPSTSKRAATPIKHETNGELENGVSAGESDTARKEAVAVAEQRKKQLEDLEAENSRLTNELSAARTKVASLKDEDYAETALFKTFKLQHEDVIKRVNDLEATNVQLREEAQKYQAERTQHRAHIEEDNRAQTTENESMIARIEVDLARIRNSRDELTSELAIRKSTDDEKRISSEQIKELAAAKDIRITALESEVERLKLQVGEAQAAECDHSGLNEEALRAKLRTLENQYNLLSQELPSMETAWKKTQALAAKKISEVTNSEELVTKLNAEKSKAEQKYFAAMKAKDAKESELRVLKSQNARSSEIVSQLKDADSKTRELVISLERQIAEAKDGLTKLEQQQRAVDQKHKEATTLAEGLKKQIEELNTLAAAKDKDCLAASKARREAEDALEQLKVRLEETKKSFEALRKTKATVNNSTAEDWRQLAICPVCTSNIRNTALKLCGHVFCSSCVKDLISNRSRKCPSCGKSFGSGDSMSIVLT